MAGTQRPDQRAIAEADFTRAVLDLARLRGWKVTHFRPARTETGWRTPLQGDAGFPDLVLARDGVVIHAELKSAKGRMTQEQAEWAIALGPSHRLWRQADFPAIASELSRARPRKKALGEPKDKEQPDERHQP